MMSFRFAALFSKVSIGGIKRVQRMASPCFTTMPPLLIPPGPNAIKLFTVVMYRHSMVILSFCVIKQHYLGNDCGMAVNYHGICVTNIIKLFTEVIYHHSMVILSFCVIKPYYLGSYFGMTVNYNGICVNNVVKHNLT